MFIKKYKKSKINVNSHDYHSNNNRYYTYKIKEDRISLNSKIDFLFLLYLR